MSSEESNKHYAQQFLTASANHLKNGDTCEAMGGALIALNHAESVDSRKLYNAVINQVRDVTTFAIERREFSYALEGLAALAKTSSAPAKEWTAETYIKLASLAANSGAPALARKALHAAVKMTPDRTHALNNAHGDVIQSEKGIPPRKTVQAFPWYGRPQSNAPKP